VSLEKATSFAVFAATVAPDEDSFVAIPKGLASTAPALEQNTCVCLKAT